MCVCKLYTHAHTYTYTQVPVPIADGVGYWFNIWVNQSMDKHWQHFAFPIASSNTQHLGVWGAAFVKHLLGDGPEGKVEILNTFSSMALLYSTLSPVLIRGTSLRLSVVPLRLWSWCPRLKGGSLPRSSPMFWADGVTSRGAIASMQAVAGTWLASSLSLVSVSPSWKMRSPLYPGYERQSFSVAWLFSRCLSMVLHFMVTCPSAPEPFPGP